MYLVGTAESIDHIEVLVAEGVLGNAFHGSPNFLAHRVIIILIGIGSPPNGVFRVFVHDDVFVLRRTASVNAGHHVDGIEFGQHAFVITFQR